MHQTERDAARRRLKESREQLKTLRREIDQSSTKLMAKFHAFAKGKVCLQVRYGNYGINF